MNRENQEGPDIGAFLAASLLHFYSGQPLQNLSGVDNQACNLASLEFKPPKIWLFRKVATRLFPQLHAFALSVRTKLNS